MMTRVGRVSQDAVKVLKTWTSLNQCYKGRMIFMGLLEFFPTPLSTLAINTSIKKKGRRKENNEKKQLEAYSFTKIYFLSVDNDFHGSIIPFFIRITAKNGKCNTDY